MTILVTGGAGFIGSHLTERLLADRYDVRVVDDLSSSPISIEQWKTDLGDIWNRLEFCREPIAFHAQRGQLDWHGTTGIFHLASPVGPAGILKHSGQMIQRIVEDAYAVIKLALMHKCRLVYVSTSEVYGGGVEGLCGENMACVVQANATVRLEYAIGKLAGEMAVRNTPDLDAVIIRPFNVAGPRQSSVGGFVLPRFIQQCMAGQPLTVFGDGSARRAFTHVADIVDGLVLAMDRGRASEVYNLGNPAGKTTIEDLAYKVLGEFEGSAGVTHVDGKSVYGPLYSEANDKFPDASKVMLELGWQPSRGVDDIIRDVIEYERSKVHVD